MNTPAVCDGKEQLAFEEWAKSQNFDMTEHPLHYLFLDSKTDAARQAWKAAIEYCQKQNERINENGFCPNRTRR